jgi:AcrR family transcriptional regulator
MPRPSRRERPAKPALTRAGIVGAAVRVLRAEGLDRVTMRRLAQELDTGPASLYVYVRNTAELHAAVLDALLGEVDLRAAEGSGDWRERLREVLDSYTMVLFENPSLAQSALVARPSGTNYLNLVEAVLALLKTGGVPDDRAAWGVDLLLLHATADAAEHGAQARQIDLEDDWNATERALLTADPERYPRIAGLGADLMSGPPPDRRTWKFDVLVNGVLGTPRPHSEEETQ